MELIQQTEEWQRQADEVQQGAAANMHVTKRLLKHGTETLSEITRLQQSRDFYKRRCDALQSAQTRMRDPERKMVCDILANGLTREEPVK